MVGASTLPGGDRLGRRVDGTRLPGAGGVEAPRVVLQAAAKRAKVAKARAAAALLPRALAVERSVGSPPPAPVTTIPGDATPGSCGGAA
jgi:hypothetical protein